MYQNDSFGNAMKRGYFSMPVAIRTIITVNVVIFLLQALGGSALNKLLVESFAFYPGLWTSLTQPWRFFTYQFLHAGLFHILFNMLWLWFMGRPVEQTLGPRTTTVIFLGSGIGGAIFDIIFANFLGINYVIGASGAVYGIMISFAVLFPRTPIMLFLLPPIEARYVVAGIIALDVLFLGAGDNTARIVHLGGAAVGYGLLRLHREGNDLSLWVRKIEYFWQSLTGSIKEKSSPKSGGFGSGTKKRRKTHLRSVKDAEIIEEVDQTELDRILEKISKSGYEGLTDDEKKTLFELSKRN